MKSVKRDTLTDKYTRLKANRVALTNQGPSEPAVADKLSTTELKIKKEIAIMKKLCHPNVVRLFEVIDDRQKEKVYMGESNSYLACVCGFLRRVHSPASRWIIFGESALASVRDS